MRNLSVLALVLVTGVLTAQGCVGRVVGEGAEKALGPKGGFWEEKPFAPSPADKVLNAYTRFELGKVTNEFGRHVPPSFFSYFPAEFDRMVEVAGLPQRSGGKTLVVNVSVIHYENADMTDQILGPLEQVVARVTFVDKSSGQVLAYGNAIGRTGKTVGIGPDWKAKGLARAIVWWIEEYRSRHEQ